MGNLSEAWPGRDHHGRSREQFPVPSHTAVITGTWTRGPSLPFHHQAGMDRGDCGGRAAGDCVVVVCVLSDHAAAVCFLSLPDPQHQADSAGLAALSRTQAMRFFWMNVGWDSAFCCWWPWSRFRSWRVCAAVSGDSTGRPSRYGAAAGSGVAADSDHPSAGAGWILADVILRDWMLPHYALDNATAGEAWMRCGLASRQRRGSFCLRAAASDAADIAMIACSSCCFFRGSWAGRRSWRSVEFGFTRPSQMRRAFRGCRHSTQVFFGVVAFGFAVLASICLGGPVSTGFGSMR
jgi:hypothetical protein